MIVTIVGQVCDCSRLAIEVEAIVLTEAFEGCEGYDAPVAGVSREFRRRAEEAIVSIAYAIGAYGNPMFIQRQRRIARRRIDARVGFDMSAQQKLDMGR